MSLWPGSCALRPPFIPCCSLSTPRSSLSLLPQALSTRRASPRRSLHSPPGLSPAHLHPSDQSSSLPPHATFPCNTSDLVTSPNGICWWLGGVGGIQRPEHTITGGPGSASPGPRGHFLLPPPLARGPRGPLSMPPHNSFLLPPLGFATMPHTPLLPAFG